VPFLAQSACRPVTDTSAPEKQKPRLSRGFSNLADLTAIDAYRLIIFRESDVIVVFPSSVATSPVISTVWLT
jgi:hypothetical protein